MASRSEVLVAGDEAAPNGPLGDALVQSTLLGEALDNAALGVLVLDEDGNYVAANHAACKLTGYERGELLALGAKRLVHDPELDAKLERLASGTLRAGKTWMRCKDGSLLEVAYRVGETRAAGVPFFVGVFWPADPPA